MVVFVQDGGLQWLQFELLQDVPGLVHGVFTRQGGSSLGSLASLNVSLSVGDDPTIVSANRKKIAQALQCPRIKALSQVHGAHLLNDLELEVPADGFMTQKVGVGLMIQHADCQAALLCDPVRKVIGNVHAGWRGLVQNIYPQAVQRMRDDYGTCPEDLIVCISPSLGPSKAEFKNYKVEFPEAFWEFNIGADHFDLWEITRMQFLSCGILPHHLHIAKICTYSHPTEWFSFRRHTARQELTGRHATVIAWKDGY